MAHEIAVAAELTLSINVSGRQLVAGGFERSVRTALTRYRLPADRLAVEVTETILIDGADVPTGILATLRRSGCASSWTTSARAIRRSAASRTIPSTS